MRRSTLQKKFDSILKKRPLVAGTLTGSQALVSQIKKAINAPTDIIEVRLDTFSFISQDIDSSLASSQKLLRSIRARTSKPLLLTLRSYKESGQRSVPSQKKLSDATRAQIVIPLLKKVQLVDAELSSVSFIKNVSAAARRQHVLTVHSFHHFKQAPKHHVLARLLKKSKKFKGDFFKLAVTPQNDFELGSFLKWGGAHHARPILIGMGRYGTVSRHLAYSFGSVLTFGHLGRAAAPGQPSASEIVRTTRRLYLK